MRARVPFAWEGKDVCVEFVPSIIEAREPTDAPVFPVAVPRRLAPGKGSYEYDRQTVDLMVGQLREMGCPSVDEARGIAVAAAERADR